MDTPKASAAARGPGSEVTHSVQILTPAQLRILVALCRPYLTDGTAALPASNEQIAAELFLSLDAVKAHLRNLFRVFSLDGFPQMQKRVALARLAMESGIVRRGQ